MLKGKYFWVINLQNNDTSFWSYVTYSVLLHNMLWERTQKQLIKNFKIMFSSRSMHSSKFNDFNISLMEL